MMVPMTQLFDTSSYDTELTEPSTGSSRRHLRSVTFDRADHLEQRRTSWRLDDNTIETGRRGIALARQALRESAKGRRANRKAA